jgi:hypothetical protein
MTVGDQIVLTVEATYGPDTVVQMPGSDLQLGEFEVLDHQLPPPAKDDQGHVVARSVYTLTTFSTGELEIPALKLSYRKDQGVGEESIVTTPVGITVESVLSAESEDIRDIKPPLEIPRDWLIPILALTAAAALTTALFWLWLRKKKAVQEAELEGASGLPPHIVALKALNDLSRSGLLDRGEVVRYHVEVSEIIRRYFAGRFQIDALEKTSQEVLESLPRDVSLSLPRDLLGQCDLVKFAKFHPTRSRSERVLDSAYEIVETTKPRIQLEAPSQEGEEAELTPVGQAEGT